MQGLMLRLREPSTWAGLAAVAVGVGKIADINEAPAIAEGLAAAAAPASSGDWITAGAAIIGGLFAAFMRERGSR